MTKRSRLAIGLVALTIMTLAVGGFLAKAQIGAFINKSPGRDRLTQRAQEDVLAAFGQIEKALQEGDAQQFMGLMAWRTLAGANATITVSHEVGQSRPGLHLEPIAVCVRGEQAFVVARYEMPGSKARSYLVRYAREDGTWKIVDQHISDAVPYRSAVYAYLPPDGGAFAHAGLPWRNIPYASGGAERAWKVQAIRDEFFLYIRFEAKTSLPPPDAAVPAQDTADNGSRVPAAPHALLIAVTMTDDRQTLVRASFELEVGATSAPRVIPDEVGGPGETRQVVAYSVALHGDRKETLFESRPGASNHLIEVRDRFIDVRLPLKSLGLHGRTIPDIELSRAGVAAQTGYRVARFAP
jgi:hypothetical protein